jgi:hypothetical protein
MSGRRVGRLPSTAAFVPRRLRRRPVVPRSGTVGDRRDWAVWLGVGTAIIAALGALVFNAVAATANNHQLELSRQGQLTDRYSKAVEQLGNDSTDVRMGGIYALERLMRDSPSDQPTIVEVLAGFVRDSAGKRPAVGPAPTSAPDPRLVAAQRPADILAALTVLGRRDTGLDLAGNPIDLSFTNLAGLNLSSVNLSGVKLLGAHLEGTRLVQAKLTGANLAAADLTFSDLAGADLTCSEFFAANLTHANMPDANLTNAHLSGAKLTGANLEGATTTGATIDDTGMAVTTGAPRSEQSGAMPTPRCPA